MNDVYESTVGTVQAYPVPTSHDPHQWTPTWVLQHTGRLPRGSLVVNVPPYPIASPTDWLVLLENGDIVRLDDESFVRLFRPVPAANVPENGQSGPATADQTGVDFPEYEWWTRKTRSFPFVVRVYSNGEITYHSEHSCGLFGRSYEFITQEYTRTTPKELTPDGKLVIVNEEMVDVVPSS